jgi:hypothetical protein
MRVRKTTRASIMVVDDLAWGRKDNLSNQKLRDSRKGMIFYLFCLGDEANYLSL